MFLKRIDKAAKKRILINVALLMAGTLILVAFLFIFNLPWPKPHGKQFIIMIIVGLALFTGVFLV